METTYYSTNAVSEQVGCKPWALTYALQKENLVPDRRILMGKISHRIFTAEDVTVIKDYFAIGQRRRNERG